MTNEKEKNITSEYKNARISARKIGLVAKYARGKKVDDLLKYLMFDAKNGSAILHQILKSATANANDKYKLDESSLYVKDIVIGQGPTMKRSMFGARGRTKKILKRTSHIKVVLDVFEKNLTEKTDNNMKIEKKRSKGEILKKEKSNE